MMSFVPCMIILDTVQLGDLPDLALLEKKMPHDFMKLCFPRAHVQHSLQKLGVKIAG